VRLGCGFNLLNLFRWQGTPPAPFAASEFALVARWGFTFLRIPMDYRFLWREGLPWEPGWEVVDDGVRLAARFGLHVQLNLHRAPGFWIDAPPAERTLWTDPDAQEETVALWRYAARRYRGAGGWLSFDLLNEPTGVDLEPYQALVRRLVAAIRGVDPDRPVFVEGLEVATRPVPGLADLGVGQAVHCYAPHWLTHWRAEWVYRGGDPYLAPPTYPGREPPRRDRSLPDDRPWWDRARLAAWLAPWAELARSGVPVHCGEFRDYRHTPRAAALAWCRDLLGLLREAGIDWALWNLTGPFGVIDSGRPDVAYEQLPDGRGLDRELLEVLRAHLSGRGEGGQP